MSWLTSVILKSILSWLTDFIVGLLEGWAQMRANEKKNEEIKAQVDAAQTPTEVQDALNEAASHLGRRSP